MIKTLSALTDQTRSALYCVWIKTGNPAQPLICVWIDRELRIANDEGARSQGGSLCA